MALDEVFENALHCTEVQATRSSSVIKVQNILAPHQILQRPRLIVLLQLREI